MQEDRPIKPRSTKLLITATIALGLLVMAAAGGFAYLNHEARSRAQAQIDTFSSRLPAGVAFDYAGFDTDVVSRVFVMERIRLSDKSDPARRIDIRRLEVRDLEVDGAGEPVRYHATLQGIRVDLQSLASRLSASGIAIPEALTGDCQVAYADDAGTGMRGIQDLTADFPGFGRLRMALQIQSPLSIGELQRLQETGRMDAVVVDDLHFFLDWQDDRLMKRVLTGETRDNLLGALQMAAMLAETDPRMAGQTHNLEAIRRFVENPDRIQVRLTAKAGGQGRFRIDSLESYDLSITTL